MFDTAYPIRPTAPGSAGGLNDYQLRQVSDCLNDNARVRFAEILHRETRFSCETLSIQSRVVSHMLSGARSNPGIIKAMYFS